MSSTEDEFVESDVGHVNDLKEGEMKEVSVGTGKALLIREKGRYKAIGHQCTHYKAPLVKGVLCNGRVRCPWHGACFNTDTGDIEEYPGMDGVEKFTIIIRGSRIFVRASKSGLELKRRVKPVVKKSPQNNETVLILGGGAAGMMCAETLRQEGYTGRVVIATAEPHLPYDRPKLSKSMDIAVEKIWLRTPEYLESCDIDVMCEKKAKAIDFESGIAKFEDGSYLKYDKLVVATGGKPRELRIPGHDLSNVCYLRTPEDAKNIINEARGKHVVVIGSSFIGMEVVSCLADKVASLSVLDLCSVAFELALGPLVGAAIQKLHEKKGVRFLSKTGIKEFRGGEDGKVGSVLLSTGEELPAELCVVGIGVMPSTSFISNDSQLKMTRGFIDVDKCMRSSLPNVFAAGDIAYYPLFLRGGQKVSIGHWQIAHSHGRAAAFSVMGREEPVHNVPYFWTVQYGKSLRYCGYGPGFDDVIIHGSLEDLKFVVFYTKEETVVAVASLNFDPLVSEVAEIMDAGQVINKVDIQANPLDTVADMLKQVQLSKVNDPTRSCMMQFCSG